MAVRFFSRFLRDSRAFLSLIFARLFGRPGTRNGGTDMDGKPRTELAHEESWETTLRILSVTQFSAHHCCKAAARHMIAGGRGGSIIVVGSVMAGFCHPSSSAYTTSKCAIRKLGEVSPQATHQLLVIYRLPLSTGCL
jgi:NAD(P)-dependent dehydrogenase (short-subunit alcohol dehydrogenase family)